jgi:cyclopropane fatty-acyl-phospholipid synthase-like methyltransferase
VAVIVAAGALAAAAGAGQMARPVDLGRGRPFEVAQGRPFDGAQGRLRAPDVKYVPTPQSAVEAMLELARVTADDIVYDLGSGDGRIPITAAKKYGARGVGIEIDRFYLRDAMDNLAKAGVADRVTFLNQDLFESDISPATVVTLFLLPRLNQQLIPKLKRELRPGTRVLSHQFDMGDQWPAEQTRDVNGLTIYLWTIR